VNELAEMVTAGLFALPEAPDFHEPVARHVSHQEQAAALDSFTGMSAALAAVRPRESTAVR